MRLSHIKLATRPIVTFIAHGKCKSKKKRYFAMDLSPSRQRMWKLRCNKGINDSLIHYISVNNSTFTTLSKVFTREKLVNAYVEHHCDALAWFVL